MKVEDPRSPRRTPPRPAPRKGFSEALRARTGRPTALAGVPRAPRPPELPARIGDRLRSVRRAHDAVAHERLRAGQASSSRADGRLNERAEALIRSALVREAPQDVKADPLRHSPRAERVEQAPGRGESGARAGGTSLAANGPRNASGTEPEAAAPHSALELVERVEVFLRSNRPALAMTVRGPLAGRVEVTRVGPGAVAIRLAHAGTPPAQAELARVRSALAARGLALVSLVVSPRG